ncbi:grasp-with-spasm system SPASM domain peptide maturase [Niabella sp. CJ426]|uniref:grasp-with-spasm system SPASM domain peptide maturase n=1 Tax=Niabella sp. CJ426 TaxID=3393740 RepID=UPI003D084F0A
MDTIPAFKLYANCVPVKGHSRSTICDLQRNKVHLIPNGLYDILVEFQGRTLHEIKENFNHEYDEVLDEYFDFLKQEDLIFHTHAPEWFPELEKKWSYPFEVKSCIIDIDQNCALDFPNIVDQLNDLNCKYLQIRCYSTFPLSFFVAILNETKGTTITSIDLILKFSEEVSEHEWGILCDSYKQITGLSIHSSPIQKENATNEFDVPIIFSTKQIHNETCCGVINEGYFVAHTDNFMESLQYNSCLNRKISIDRHGYIKNCPSMQLAFGNIATKTLQQALSENDFKKFWNINKDTVEVCQDCEFRHVCTDCRAYIDNPHEQQSKPLKCGYDPYNCKWEEWSNHPLKMDAINYYQIEH